MKTARRRAREVALQALYAWQLAGGASRDVLEQARGCEGYAQCDAALADTLVRGVVERAAELEALIAPRLESRSFAGLSPVERAILYIGAFELAAQEKTPFKVVLNEAVELGRSFGGTDGYRFVNAVLERLAAALRPTEFTRERRSA